MLVARLVGGREKLRRDRADGFCGEELGERAGLQYRGEDAPKRQSAEVRADHAAVGVGDRCGPRKLCARHNSTKAHARARGQLVALRERRGVRAALHRCVWQTGSLRERWLDHVRGGTDALKRWGVVLV